jgi:hypothetical protein
LFLKYWMNGIFLHDILVNWKRVSFLRVCHWAFWDLMHIIIDLPNFYNLSFMIAPCYSLKSCADSTCSSIITVFVGFLLSGLEQFVQRLDIDDITKHSSAPLINIIIVIVNRWVSCRKSAIFYTHNFNSHIQKKSL